MRPLGARRIGATLLALLAASPALAAEPAKRPAPPREKAQAAAPEIVSPELPIPSFREMMQLTPGPSAPQAQPAPEGPVDPNADVAFGAYQRGFYRQAFEEATRRAAANPPDPAAMTLLGELYANGYFVPRAPKLSLDWYGRAAQAGDPKAMTALALAHQGNGGAKDETAAMALFERASEKNEPEALYNLAVLRLERGGSPQQTAAAARLMKRAAELGEAAAQYAYAALLKEGRGVERDQSAAAEWMRRAAEQDDVAALVEYGIMVFNGAGVVKNEAEAARLFRRAADQGNPIGQNRLARLYAYGRGVERDAAKAAAWHKLASRQGLRDPWLEGFAETLQPEDRAAADALVERWSEGFGPVARVAAAPAASAATSPQPTAAQAPTSAKP
ncbi:tetratricopeptide repeat protein [Chenggangzhangella methanolivorans]|nr:tetratricopeptide repeat protein [Chenggangzhangella methanolivorans]